MSSSSQQRSKAFGVKWDDDALDAGQKADPGPQAVPKEPAQPKTPKARPRPQGARNPVGQAADPGGELARLGADPVAYIEAMPAVKRGALRRAFNSDLPGDLGLGLAAWCARNEVTQRDVLRAFVTALLADGQAPKSK